MRELLENIVLQYPATKEIQKEYPTLTRPTGERLLQLKIKLQEQCSEAKRQFQ